MLQCRHQIVPDRFSDGDMDCCRDHIVLGLAHIHMIIGVDRFPETDRLSHNLTHAIRDHLVGVHVRACARTGLEDVDRKVAVQFSFYYLLRGLNDETAALLVESLKIPICLRGRPLDESERTNEWTTEPIPAHREIEDCTLGRRAIQRISRHLHSAHGIFFGAGCLHS